MVKFDEDFMLKANAAGIAAWGATWGLASDHAGEQFFNEKVNKQLSRHMGLCMAGFAGTTLAIKDTTKDQKKDVLKLMSAVWAANSAVTGYGIAKGTETKTPASYAGLGVGVAMTGVNAYFGFRKECKKAAPKATTTTATKK